MCPGERESVRERVKEGEREQDLKSEREFHHCVCVIYFIAQHTH